MKKGYLSFLLCVIFSAMVYMLFSIDVKSDIHVYPEYPKSVYYGQDTASDDDYLLAISGIASYSTGLMITFSAVTANTGACTVNVNSLGTKNIKSLNNQDPQDNYIEANSIVLLVYDGTSFQMLQPDANL